MCRARNVFQNGLETRRADTWEEHGLGALTYRVAIARGYKHVPPRSGYKRFYLGLADRSRYTASRNYAPCVMNAVNIPAHTATVVRLS